MILRLWTVLYFRPILVLRMILVHPVLVRMIVGSFLGPVVIVAFIVPSVRRSAVVLRRRRERTESALGPVAA
jgi:uncharacterized protein (DUF2062 family)